MEWVKNDDHFNVPVKSWCQDLEDGAMAQAADLARHPVVFHHNYAAQENHFNQNVWIHRKGATSAKLDETGIIPGPIGTSSYIVKDLGNAEKLKGVKGPPKVICLPYPTKIERMLNALIKTLENKHLNPGPLESL